LSLSISKIIDMNNRMLGKLDHLQKTVDDVNKHISKLAKQSDNDNETKIHADPNFIKVRNYIYVGIGQFF
jgi:hypothetical protein